MENGTIPSVVIQNCSSRDEFWMKGAPFRVVIGITCFLSVIGALLIIFSYVAFKSLRNDARLILVHLSLMDLGVGLSNLIGNFIYFDQYYFPNGECSAFQQPKEDYIRHLCVVQGFFAHFFTQGSILWTVSLAVFLYFRILQHRTQLSKLILWFSYVFCYGIPTIICLWLVLTNRFGYSQYNTGWCSILIINSNTYEPDIFVAVFGYDLWTYLAMVLVLVLYLSIQVFVRQKLRQARKYLTASNTEERFWDAVNILDYQFLSIPFAFIVLRAWTCLEDLLFVYICVKAPPFWLNVAMQYLTGIGDSAQGFANGILFVIFTSTVRRTVFKPKYWRAKLTCSNEEEVEPLLGRERDPVQTISINSPGSFTDSGAGSDIYTPSYSGTFTGGDRQTHN